MRKIILNKIKCNHYGNAIVSEYTHNFKWCKYDGFLLELEEHTKKMSKAETMNTN